MKNPFDAHAISATIERALASAGLDTTSGPMHRVTDTIRRALGVGEALHETAPTPPPAAPAAPVVEIPAASARPGHFERREFSNPAGTLSYKLYVPPADSLPAGPARPPLVVMLHGCTQSADDFAAGTQMNRLADVHGFLVLYPEQSARANGSRCWNWFKPQDQVRDAGEPSLIAGMVREVTNRHDVDPRRVFVAGLSAGAAMAVVLGETYADLFAGVGAHSGLAYGSAHDIPSAMAAMKGRHDGGAARARLSHAVPVIVFHGDRDHTVHPGNGQQIVQQFEAAYQAQMQAQMPVQAGAETLQATELTGTAPGERRFTCLVQLDAAGRPRIEHWTVHGAGHAWSGGHASGSFTDSKGPDASAEMVRFFLALA